MRKWMCFSLCFFILFLVSCGKKTPTSPDSPTVTYALSDLVGNWTGTVKNSSNTITLNLNVDSAGKVTGSGVSSTWTIDSTGKVKGGGSFSFTGGGYLTVASAGWSLQMDSAKKKLTGTLDVSYSTLHNMTADLSKK